MAEKGNRETTGVSRDTYLLVELGNVVVGLVLCLDDGGVLLYVL